MAETDDAQIDKNARFAIAYGKHAVRGYRLKKRVNLVGNNKEIYLRYGLGLDEWDGCDGLYYNGNVIAPADFSFHHGGPVDVADAFFPGETYPGAAYVNVRLRGAFAEDDNPDDIEGVYRCLKVADYNGAGQQIDSNGNLLPVGATPRNYYFYSQSPARQMIDLILRWGLRKATIIDWTEWVNWKEDCAALIGWNDGTSAREIPRFLSNLFFMPPFFLRAGMKKIAEVACAEWERANGKLYFLTPHARNPIFTFDLTKLPIGAFKTYPVDKSKKFTKVMVYFRDLDTPLLVEAGKEGAAPVVEVERAIGPNEEHKILEIKIGGAYASQAQRVGEYNARVHCDLGQIAEFEGSPDSYSVLPASVVELSDVVPTWDGVQFKIYEKEETEDTKLGYPMVGMLYDPNCYSDTDHGPITRPLPPADPNVFASPPQVTSVTLAERNILQADQTVVTLLQVTAQFAPYVNKQIGRVWYKKSTEAWNQAKDGGTIDPAIDTLVGSLEIRGVEKTAYDVRVVPESSFAAADSNAATSASRTITGKVTLPASPTSLALNFEALSGKIRGTFLASTDGDIQFYEVYTVAGAVETLYTKVGGSLEFTYTPPSNWNGALSFKVYARNWSGFSSSSGATNSIAPPALPSITDFWVEDAGHGRETLYYFSATGNETGVVYEVYKNLTGATQISPAPPAHSAADTKYTGGTPSNLMYRGANKKFLLSQDSPLNTDSAYVRAVDRFGNTSQWTQSDNYFVWNAYSTTGNEIDAPVLSVDGLTSLTDVLALHIASANLVGSVTATRVQIRQQGTLWPSTANGSSRQFVFNGLQREVLVPWLRGGIVEVRVKFDGAPDSDWSNTITHDFGLYRIYATQYAGWSLDGFSDDSAIIQQMIDEAPDGAELYFPNWGYGVAEDIVIPSTKQNLIFRGAFAGHNTNVPGDAPTFHALAEGINIFKIDGCSAVQFLGLAFQCHQDGGASDVGADSAIFLCSSGAEGDYLIRDCYINFSGVRSSFAGIRIGYNAGANNENIAILNTTIYASNSGDSTNDDRGRCIVIEDNPNALGVLIGERSWLKAGRVAFYGGVAGNWHIEDSFFTYNGFDVHMKGGDPCSIDNCRSEQARHFLKMEGGHLSVNHSHFDLTDTLSSGSRPTTHAIEMDNGRLVIENSWLTAALRNDEVVMFRGVGGGDASGHVETTEADFANEDWALFGVNSALSMRLRKGGQEILHGYEGNQGGIAEAEPYVVVLVKNGLGVYEKKNLVGFDQFANSGSGEINFGSEGIRAKMRSRLSRIPQAIGGGAGACGITNFATDEGSVVGTRTTGNRYLNFSDGEPSGGDPDIGWTVRRNGGNGDIEFKSWQGGFDRQVFKTNLHVDATLSKNAGTFDIPHPLPELAAQGVRLRHGFIEGPFYGLQYWGESALIKGRAEINLDERFGMTPGTFKSLARDAILFMWNADDSTEGRWDRVAGVWRATLQDGHFVIESEKGKAKTCGWMVMAERNDEFVRGPATNTTDSAGEFITEYHQKMLPLHEQTDYSGRYTNEAVKERERLKLKTPGALMPLPKEKDK
ncbi:MAG: hypothetical protein ICV60_18215 [Pyrinomonadaceae bacterium]|nr:hypothetical protein [Pyrinomonadaceae bacterium]